MPVRVSLCFIGHVRKNDSDRPERTVGGGTPSEGCDKAEVRKIL